MIGRLCFWTARKLMRIENWLLCQAIARGAL